MSGSFTAPEAFNECLMSHNDLLRFVSSYHMKVRRPSPDEESLTAFSFKSGVEQADDDTRRLSCLIDKNKAMEGAYL